ncbi:MAG: ExbD/TolR family protein [Planctomycetaceae bacterium]
MAQSKIVAELRKAKDQMDMTPIIDISFLLIIFFICLPFKTLEGKLQAFLPTDKGLNPTPQDPIAEFKISVHIVARNETQRQYGPPGAIQSVMMPERFRFRFGDQETDDIEELTRWMAAQKNLAAGNADMKLLGEIKAGHKVPHKYVVAVLNRFAMLQLDKVDFYGTALPTPEQRKLEYLRYPSSNYVGGG